MSCILLLAKSRSEEAHGCVDGLLAESWRKVGGKLAESWRIVGGKLADCWRKVGGKLAETFKVIHESRIPSLCMMTSYQTNV